MLIDKEVESLLKILNESKGKSARILLTEVRETIADQSLQSALKDAILGENRPLNAWLFSEGEKFGANLVWIAPIKSVEPRYVWMIGKPNETSLKVHRWYKQERQKMRDDPLLAQREIPPPLLFVDPLAISSASLSELINEDEFAIFQTGYEKTPDEVRDLEQRMVINMRYSVTKRKAAQKRLKYLCGRSDEVVYRCDENLELFSILHNEGHNQGHFVGYWPHEDDVKKNTVLYEAVEEFRACLASVLLTLHLPLSMEQKEAFAVNVFATRFLGFGFDAFKLQNQRRETAREITVGVFFFEWLVAEGVLEFNRNNMALKINSNKIINAIKSAFSKIDNAEKAGTCQNGDILRTIAIEWYELCFPDGQYSQNVKKLYTNLSKGGDIHED